MRLLFCSGAYPALALTMSAKRKNTLVIDLSVLPVRSSAGIVKQFLDEKLHLDMTSVKNIQLHSTRNCALIEMCSLEAAERIAAAHHLKHSIVVEKKNFHIPVYMEDNTINVRVHDLPPGIPNAAVADAMQHYGKVKSVARELWKKFFPGIPNGVRVVRMELNKQIPSTIQILNQVCTITYRSQKRKSQNGSNVSDEHKSTNPQSLIVHDEADNHTPMDVAIEEQPNLSKRSVGSSTETMKSPPRKKAMHGIVHVTAAADQQITEARSVDERREIVVRNETKPLNSENADDESSDAESGPDPAYDDLEAWTIKLNRRSRRQDKRIEKVLGKKL